MLEIQQIHISALQRFVFWKYLQYKVFFFCIVSLHMLQLLCKEKWKFTNQMSYVPNLRPLRGQEAKQTCSLPWHLQANELPYAERTQRKTNVQAHSRVLCMHSLTTVSLSEVHSETTWQQRCEGKLGVRQIQEVTKWDLQLQQKCSLSQIWQ